MTPEQLKNTRAERWRQQGNAVLTLDDAQEWLNQTGLCLFLPRRTQLPAPAPSFVEACLGRESATPKPQEIEEATSLLDRALDDGKLVPLNLLGAMVEQADFLATADALPAIFALRGDRDWKSGPKGQSSPLVIEVWKVLDREGAMTAVEIQEKLGRELTEAAVHRALNELWGALRVVPVFSTESKAGRIVHWELLQARFQQSMHKGGGMSRSAALSSLVSLYLQSAIAATEEEIETFLSPLSSRSKIREAVRGLGATRQLGMTSSGTEVVYHIAGELPEFPEVEVVAEDAPATGYIPRHEGGKRPAYKRPSFAQSGGERKRPAARTPRREGGAFAPRAEGGKRPPVRRSAEAGAGERRPYKPRTEGDKPFERKSFGSDTGERRPYKPRTEGSGAGSRPPFRKSGSDSGPRKSFGAGAGERRPYKPRTEGEKPFERKSFGSDTGERRPYKPRTEGSGAGSRPPFRKSGSDSGPRKSFGAGAGERRPYKPRTEGSAPRREGSGERPASRGGFGSKPGFKSAGSRPAFRSGSRPAGSRSGSPTRSGGFSKRPGGAFKKSPGGGFKRKPREDKGE